MKVFLSWSGETSHKIALLLRDWLPTIFPQVKPWISSEDIQKGGRWGLDLAKELQDTTWGIICVDPTNLNSPWLNYEAGALSKTIQMGRVAPLLFRLKPSDLRGPLSQFQATSLEKADVFKLVKSLNSSLDEKVSSERIEKMFNLTWPAIREAIAKLPVDSKQEQKQADQRRKESKDSNDELRSREVQVLRSIAHALEATSSSQVEISVIRSKLGVKKVELRSTLRKLYQREFINYDYDNNWCLLLAKGEDYLVDNELLQTSAPLLSPNHALSADS